MFPLGKPIGELNPLKNPLENPIPDNESNGSKRKQWIK